MDLSTDALNIINVCDFVFFKDFYRNFLICIKMYSFLNFPKGALPKRFCDSVAADNNWFNPVLLRNFRLIW